MTRADAPAPPAEDAVPLSGRVEEGRHRLWLRVYYEDTDAAGIVYYANYLRYAERARTEMLRLIGVSQFALHGEAGLAFAVKDCTVDYRRPARLDDLLEVRSWLSSLTRAQLTAEQHVLNAEDGGLHAVLRVRVACLDAQGRVARIPPPIAAALKPYCQSGE